MQHRDYRRIALTVNDGQPLTDYHFYPKTILVLGRELTGVPEAVLKHCEDRVMIPQYGQVESLNVAVAGAIALYEYRRQHPLKIE